MAVTLKTSSHPRRVVQADLILNTPKIKTPQQRYKLCHTALKYNKVKVKVQLYSFFNL